MQFSTKKMGVNFFFEKMSNRGGGGWGGVAHGYVLRVCVLYPGNSAHSDVAKACGRALVCFLLVFI